MVVVVTGAAGFIGTSLVRELASRGHRVAGIDRRPGVPAQAVAALTADVVSDEATDLLRAADAVFHLAGRPGVRDHSPEADRLRSRDNVEATEHVCAVVGLSTPLVVTSSSSVYGGSRGRPCAETDRLRPVGGYARSKVDVERACARQVSRGGLVAVARPFTVAGEGQRPDMAIAAWLADARAGRPLRLFGSPGRTRDITDVRDVVDGLIRMAERNVRSTINLGTGTPHRLDAVAAVVAGVAGAPAPVEVVPATVVEPAATLADTRRCARLLGFTPRTDLPALVRRQAAGLPTLETA